MRRCLKAFVMTVSLLLSASHAYAGAIVPASFNGNTLAGNDDGSTGFVSFGFAAPLNFYGVPETGAFVNNNGNITFTAPLSTFTPFGITGGSLAMLAPFFADIDTRGASPDVTYGDGSFDGHDAWGVNYAPLVGYFNQSPGPNRLSAQLVIVDRADTGAGNFDFMFNYDIVQWEAGQASGSDADGCGGTSARVGWTNGSGTSFELPGSGVHGAFLDSGTCVDGSPYAGPGPNALILHSLNSNVDGRYVFSVREGVVVSQVPEPASLVLVGSGIAGLLRRRVRAPKA